MTKTSPDQIEPPYEASLAKMSQSATETFSKDPQTYVLAKVVRLTSN